MKAADLLVDALAVHRLVHLLQRDEVWPVREAREAFEDWAGDTRWADLATCSWCLSVWVGAAAAVARHRWPRTWSVAARILAASTATGLLEHHLDTTQ